MIDKEIYKREYIRMMDSVRDKYKGSSNCSGVECKECPITEVCNGTKPNQFEMIEAVEEWAKEHPVVEQESVLDKIRAEIEQLIEWHDCPVEYDNGNDYWYCQALNTVLQIIDKYRKE